MLKFLISLVNPVSAIAEKLSEAYLAKTNATTEQARISADVDIKQLEARQTVLIAEQKHSATRWIRPAFVLPFIIYDFKVLVWDKVLGLGVTDDLSPEFWQLQMLVFGAYFLTRPLQR